VDKITPCECELSGWCKRHNIRKPDAWIKLCRTKPKYFEAWERGRGPGQQLKVRQSIAGVQYNHWAPLHYYAVKHAGDWNQSKAKQWYRKWVSRIPNRNGCGCKEKWKALGIPFDFSTPMAFFKSAWRGHNDVNRTIGKPTITLCEAIAIWWTSQLSVRIAQVVSKK